MHTHVSWCPAAASQIGLHGVWDAGNMWDGVMSPSRADPEPKRAGDSKQGPSRGIASSPAATPVPPPPPQASSASTATAFPHLRQPQPPCRPSHAEDPRPDGGTPFSMRCGVGDTCCAVTAAQRIIERIMADALHHMRHEAAAAVCNQFLAFLGGVMGDGGPPSLTAEKNPGAVAAALGGVPLDIDSLTDMIVPTSPEAEMRSASVVQAAVETVLHALRDAPPEVRPPRLRRCARIGPHMHADPAQRRPNQQVASAGGAQRVQYAALCALRTSAGF